MYVSCRTWEGGSAILCFLFFFLILMSQPLSKLEFEFKEKCKKARMDK